VDILEVLYYITSIAQWRTRRNQVIFAVPLISIFVLICVAFLPYFVLLYLVFIGSLSFINIVYVFYLEIPVKLEH